MSQSQLINELKMIKHESLFADVIRNEPKGSIQMISEQIKDNRCLCIEIIGEKLVCVIEGLV